VEFLVHQHPGTLPSKPQEIKKNIPNFIPEPASIAFWPLFAQSPLDAPAS
jgi:hypothetical protein